VKGCRSSSHLCAQLSGTLRILTDAPFIPLTHMFARPRSGVCCASVAIVPHLHVPAAVLCTSPLYLFCSLSSIYAFCTNPSPGMGPYYSSCGRGATTCARSGIKILGLAGPAKTIDRDHPAHTNNHFAYPTKVTNTERVPQSAISSRWPLNTRTSCVLSAFIHWLCMPREYPHPTSRRLGPKPNHFIPIIDWFDGSAVAISTIAIWVCWKAVHMGGL